MKTQRPEALALANTALQVRNKDTPDDVYVALGDCAWALRNLHAENERLRAGYDATRHEIANLQERVQELGQMARYVNSRRVIELEAQLEAVGAGGVEPLMRAAKAEPHASERAAFVRWHTKYLRTDAMLAAHVWDREHVISQAWRAALASQAQPVAQARAIEAAHGITAAQKGGQHGTD